MKDIREREARWMNMLEALEAFRCGFDEGGACESQCRLEVHRSYNPDALIFSVSANVWEGEAGLQVTCERHQKPFHEGQGARREFEEIIDYLASVAG